MCRRLVVRGSPGGRCGAAVRARLARPGRGAALLAVALAACAPSVPAEWTVDLVEVLTLGEEPPSLQTAFYRPLAIGHDAFGNVYVLDSGNHRVQVFDDGGSYLRTLGRPGEGPGELQEPMGMWVFPNGEVVVADTRNRRLQPFGAAGEALEPIVLDYVPLGVVGGRGRLWVARMPRATLVLGPDDRPLIEVLSRSGAPLMGMVEPLTSSIGAVYLLENTLRLAPAPGNGLAVANTHFISRIRVYDEAGTLQRQVPVLYKASAWAPLGDRPERLDEESLERIARTTSDLAWDPVRRFWWLLCGYSDRTPEGEWVVGQELYRYDAEGVYRGSAMLPFRGIAVSVAYDGRVWVVDADGVVHALRVVDPEMAAAARE